MGVKGLNKQTNSGHGYDRYQLSSTYSWSVSGIMTSPLAMCLWELNGNIFFQAVAYEKYFSKLNLSLPCKRNSTFSTIHWKLTLYLTKKKCCTYKHYFLQPFPSLNPLCFSCRLPLSFFCMLSFLLGVQSSLLLLMLKIMYK